ncbi:polysaccharide lyase 8 family protein [Paenibacillus roseipurpureus]|uniref:Polysaccharide lyase 8 family protein n=1 Tax=Paenibacillus roseopurpureus TaxID=2918901 RepID=A0AA96RL09_9BACL|nr:polysaccharide lyase 8 family protein [Paenibacillus sp. MBLB1832]WNR45275.1 polysaccharide lyase 8 family protein [Paenibacillus sp. MBLB1832]
MKTIFDSLRNKWERALIGGTSLDKTDPDIAHAVEAVEQAGWKAWGTMEHKDTGIGGLWKDLPFERQGFSAWDLSPQVTQSFRRVKDMAMAYRVASSQYAGDEKLKQSIVAGLEWLLAWKFNANIEPYDNWWDWEIGIPLVLVDILTLMYEDLSAPVLETGLSAIDRFCPDLKGRGYEYWGANRAWRVCIIAVRGILGQNPDKMIIARDGVSDAEFGGERSLFKYVNHEDGFYQDGSFIQHGNYAYTGGYGIGLIRNLADAMYILENSPWSVQDPESAHIYQWVEEGYAPLMVGGLMMDMVRGREISREQMPDYQTGISMILALTRVAEFAPTEPIDYKSRIKGRIKGWLQETPHPAPFQGMTLSFLASTKEILQDATITVPGEADHLKIFASMDRVVHRRGSYAFGISMSSKRVGNYEDHHFNDENLRAWYTGDGMTYLYTPQDRMQYSGAFWPTVDPYRLAGTTVTTRYRRDYTDGSWHLPPSNWVGGASLGNKYGAVGMQLKGYAGTLQAKKSWFLFDHEIVALGADITCDDPHGVETIVENRRMSDRTFTIHVDGREQVPDAGHVTASTSTKWLHLGGGQNIGYVFPQGGKVKFMQEERIDRWFNINRSGKSMAAIRNRYMTIWMDHGMYPDSRDYAYILLPQTTPHEVVNYARRPSVQILENRREVQAVKHETLNIVSANFWMDEPVILYEKGQPLLACFNQASVVVEETAEEIRIALSDPTQENEVIRLELYRSAASVETLPEKVTVEQLEPSIIISAQVANLQGATLELLLRCNNR